MSRRLGRDLLQLWGEAAAAAYDPDGGPVLTVRVASRNSAKNLAAELYKIRSRARSRSRAALHPDDPAWGTSPWDELRIVQDSVEPVIYFYHIETFKEEYEIITPTPPLEEEVEAILFPGTILGLTLPENHDTIVPILDLEGEPILPPQPSKDWIVVRDTTTGRLFPERASTRVQYQRSTQFEIVGKDTYPTRDAARAEIKRLKGA